MFWTVCTVTPCVCLGHIVGGDELDVPSRDKKLSPGSRKNPAVSTHKGWALRAPWQQSCSSCPCRGEQWVLTWHVGSHGNCTYRKWGVWGHERNSSFPAKLWHKRWLNALLSCHLHICFMFYGFSGGSDSIDSAGMQETEVWSWIGKIPCRREWLPTPVSLPGQSHGQRILAVSSAWGHRESDTTE